MKEKQRDTGYAWVILLVTLLNNSIWAGVYASSSVYMLDWLEEFNATKAEVGMIGGTQNGINYFSGLFVGPLVDRYGCRCVGMIGTLLTVVGLIAGAFATSIIWLYISYGIIVGIGIGWISMPAILMVQYYFDKHRPFAGGISLMGYGLGTFCVLPLLRFLVPHYGWRGTMVLHAGMALQLFVLNMLYRPFDLSSIKEEHGDIKQHNQQKLSTENSKEKLQLSKNNSKEEEIHSQKHLGTAKKCSEFLSKLWDFSIFKIPVYIQFTLAIVISQCAVVFMFRFIAVKAHEDGLSKMQASLLPSIGGLSSTVSRTLFSFIANLQCTNRILQCGLGCLAQGVCIILSCSAWDFGSYTVFITLSGIFVGQQFTVSYTVMADLMGVKRLAQANSFLSMFIGLAILIALPLAGLLVDKTNNFDIAFYMFGAITCVSGILILTLTCTRNNCSMQSSPSSSFNEIEEKKMTRTDAVKMYFSTESIHSVT